jgi:hypothetical protein
LLVVLVLARAEEVVAVGFVSLGRWGIPATNRHRFGHTNNSPVIGAEFHEVTGSGIGHVEVMPEVLATIVRLDLGNDPTIS